MSVREAEVHHVAVLTTYSLPSRRILPASLAPPSPFKADVVVVGDGLGADEALLEVGVDDAGRRRRLGAARDRPGARFLRADREVGDEVEQLIARADQAVEAGFRRGPSRPGTRRALPAARPANSLSILAEMTTAPHLRPSRAPRPSSRTRCRWRPTLRRRCRRRGRASTSAAAAPRKTGISSGVISAMRAGLPSRSRTSAFSITASMRLGVLVAGLGLLLDLRDALLEAFQIGEHQLGLDHLGVGQRDRCGSRRA